jgi:hypothetical protein
MGALAASVALRVLAEQPAAAAQAQDSRRPASVAAQEVLRWRYDQPLELTDLGAWPLERLAPVTLVLEEVDLRGDWMNLWLWVQSTDDWAPHPSQPGRCCLLVLVPDVIYLLDAQSQRHDGRFPTDVRHLVGPGKRLLILVNFPAAAAAQGPLTLHLEAGVGLAAEPEPDPTVRPRPASASAEVDERTLEYLRAMNEARAPVERGRWVLADIRVP